MAVAGAVGVVTQGTIKRAITGQGGLSLVYLLRGQQSGGNTHFVQYPMCAPVPFQHFRRAGKVKQTLVSAIKRQVQLILQFQKAFTAVYTKAKHGALVETEQARRPGIAQSRE